VTATVTVTVTATATVTVTATATATTDRQNRLVPPPAPSYSCPVRSSPLLSSIAAVIVAALGCGGGSSSSPAPVAPVAAAPPAAAPAAAPCARLAATMMRLNADRMFAQLSADERAVWQPKFTAVFETACTEDAWPAPAVACGADATDAAAFEACGADLGPEAEKKMVERMQPLITEMMATLAPATAAPGEPAGNQPSGIAACDQYIATFEAYLSCGKVTASLREASQANLAALRRGFASAASATPAKRQEASDACTRGEQALRKSAADLGCTL
jgi:hypothetical protein